MEEHELAAAFNNGVKDAEENIHAASDIITITVYAGKDEEKNKKLTDLWCVGTRYAHIISKHQK